MNRIRLFCYSTVFLLAVSSVLAARAQNSTSQPSTQTITYYGQTGESLLAECRNVNLVDQAPDHLVRFHTERCIRYILGLVDGIQAAGATRSERMFFCIPDSPGTPSEEEFVKVILKYGDDHPEDMHRAAAVLVVKALARAYPCPTQR